MNLVLWAIFGFLIIMIMAIVSNSGQTATANIQTQMDTLGCDFPDFTLGGNSTGNGCINTNTYTNNTFTLIPAFTFYNLTVPSCVFFSCGENGTQQWVAETAPAGIPTGWLDYTADILSVTSSKLVAVGTIISYVLAPINFDVLGYTIDDLSGVALMLVIGLYVFCYTPIALLLVKGLSPFAGMG